MLLETLSLEAWIVDKAQVAVESSIASMTPASTAAAKSDFLNMGLEEGLELRASDLCAPVGSGMNSKKEQNRGFESRAAAQSPGGLPPSSASNLGSGVIPNNRYHGTHRPRGGST